jgi:hypothetical protein
LSRSVCILSILVLYFIYCIGVEIALLRQQVIIEFENGFLNSDTLLLFSFYWLFELSS